jgi:hypothetical protein
MLEIELRKYYAWVFLLRVRIIIPYLTYIAGIKCFEKKKLFDQAVKTI